MKRIPSVKVGDKVTVIAFMAPNITFAEQYDPTIYVRPNKPVAAATTEAFLVGEATFKQALLGEITRSSIEHTYNIVLPTGVDTAPYLEKAEEFLHTRTEEEIERLHANADTLLAMKDSLYTGVPVEVGGHAV